MSESQTVSDLNRSQPAPLPTRKKQVRKPQNWRKMGALQKQIDRLTEELAQARSRLLMSFVAGFLVASCASLVTAVVM